MVVLCWFVVDLVVDVACWAGCFFHAEDGMRDIGVTDFQPSAQLFYYDDDDDDVMLMMMMMRMIR